MRQEKSAKDSEAAKVGNHHNLTARDLRQLQRSNRNVRDKEAVSKGVVGLGATVACVQAANDCVGSAQQPCPTSAVADLKDADSVGVDDISHVNQCATKAAGGSSFPEIRQEKSAKVSEAEKVGVQHKLTVRDLRQLQRSNRNLRDKEEITKGIVGLGATVACLQAADDCVGNAQRPCPTSAASNVKDADSVGVDNMSHVKQCYPKASDGSSFLEMRQEKSAKVSEAAKVGDQHNLTARDLRQLQRVRQKEAKGVVEMGQEKLKKVSEPATVSDQHKVTSRDLRSLYSRNWYLRKKQANLKGVSDVGAPVVSRVQGLQAADDGGKIDICRFSPFTVYLSDKELKERKLKGVAGVGAPVSSRVQGLQVNAAADDGVNIPQQLRPTSAASNLKVADCVGVSDCSHTKQLATKASDGTSFPASVQTNANANLSETSDPRLTGRGVSSSERMSPGTASTTNCLTDHVKLGGDTHCRKRKSPEMMSTKDPLPEMRQEKSAKVSEAANVGDQVVADNAAADDGVKIPQQRCPTSAASDLKAVGSVGVGDRLYTLNVGTSFPTSSPGIVERRRLCYKNRYLRTKEGKLNGVAGVGPPVASRVQEMGQEKSAKVSEDAKVGDQGNAGGGAPVVSPVQGRQVSAWEQRRIYYWNKMKEGKCNGVADVDALVASLVQEMRQEKSAKVSKAVKVGDQGIASMGAPVASRVQGLHVNAAAVDGVKKNPSRRLYDKIRYLRKKKEKMEGVTGLGAPAASGVQEMRHEKSAKISKAANVGDKGVEDIGASVASHVQGLQVNTAVYDGEKVPQQLCPTAVASNLKDADSVGVGACSHTKQYPVKAFDGTSFSADDGVKIPQQLCPASAASDLKVADSVGVGDRSHTNQCPAKAFDGTSFPVNAAADDGAKIPQQLSPTSAASNLKVTDSVADVGAPVASRVQAMRQEKSAKVSKAVKVGDQGIASMGAPVASQVQVLQVNAAAVDGVKKIPSRRLYHRIRYLRKKEEKMKGVTGLGAPAASRVQEMRHEKSAKVSEAASLGDKGVAGVGAPVASRVQGLHVNVAAYDGEKIPQQLCPTAVAPNLKSADSIGVGECSHTKQYLAKAFDGTSYSATAEDLRCFYNKNRSIRKKEMKLMKRNTAANASIKIEDSSHYELFIFYLREKELQEATLKGDAGIGPPVASRVQRLQADDGVKIPQQQCPTSAASNLEVADIVGAVNAAADDGAKLPQQLRPTSAASNLKVADSVGLGDRSHTKQCPAKAFDGTSFPANDGAKIYQQLCPASVASDLKVADSDGVGERPHTNQCTLKAFGGTSFLADDGAKLPQQLCPTSAASDLKVADSVGLGDRSHTKQCPAKAFDGTSFPANDGAKIHQQLCPASVASDLKVADSDGVGERPHTNQCTLKAFGGTSFLADDGAKLPQQLCPTSAASFLKVADSVGLGDRSHTKQCPAKAFDGTSFPAANDGAEIPQQLCPPSAATDLKIADGVGIGDRSHTKQCPAKAFDGTSFPVNAAADDGAKIPQQLCPTSAASDLKVADSVGVDDRSHTKQCPAKAFGGTSFPVIAAADDGVKIPQQSCPTSAASNLKVGDSVGVGDQLQGKQCATKPLDGTYFPVTLRERRRLHCRNSYLRLKEAKLKGVADVGAPVTSQVHQMGQEKWAKVSEAARVVEQGVAAVGGPVASRVQVPVQTIANASFSEMSDLAISVRGASSRKRKSPGTASTRNRLTVPAQTNVNPSLSVTSDPGRSGRGASSWKRKSPCTASTTNRLTDSGISGRGARSQKRKSSGPASTTNCLADGAMEESDQIEHSETIDEETQVCKILENLSNLIHKTDSDENKFAWKAGRKRSRTRLRPSQLHLCRLEKRARVAYGNPSPTSPFYISGSKSDSKNQGFRKKAPKKKLIEDLIKKINTSVKANESLSKELEKVNSYSNKLETYNKVLQAKQQEMQMRETEVKIDSTKAST